MFPCKLLLYFSFVLSNFAINHALKVEEIVGGYPAFQPNHKHHAAIVGKDNGSDYLHLVCSGVIIGNFHILSALTCFFDNFFLKLKKLSFSVLVGSTEIKAYEPYAYVIDKIFIAGLDNEYISNDLAVSKLKESLNLDNNPHLRRVIVPYPNGTNPKSALVAGYGTKTYDPLSTQTQRATQHPIIVNTVMNLTYAFVEISENENCQEQYNSLDKLLYICGVMKPDMNFKRRGLCVGDAGAPLIRDDEILGIAIRSNEDCDDTQRGNIYVKIPFHKEFIDAIVSGNTGNLRASPFIFSNPAHYYVNLSLQNFAQHSSIYI